MTNTGILTHPTNLALIDQSEVGTDIAGYLFLLAASCGDRFASEPVETITERDMVNADDWSDADLRAWQQAEDEARAEDLAVSRYFDNMEDEARYRDEFWD